MLSGGMQSHAWLQQGSTTIDITADQFPEVSARVIVEAVPTSFHRTFVAAVQHDADFRIYDAYTSGVLAALYARITALVRE